MLYTPERPMTTAFRTPTLERPEVRERTIPIEAMPPLRTTDDEPPRRPRRYVRWLGLLAGVLALVGVAVVATQLRDEGTEQTWSDESRQVLRSLPAQPDTGVVAEPWTAFGRGLLPQVIEGPWTVGDRGLLPQAAVPTVIEGPWTVVDRGLAPAVIEGPWTAGDRGLMPAVIEGPWTPGDRGLTG